MAKVLNINLGRPWPPWPFTYFYLFLLIFMYFGYIHVFLLIFVYFYLFSCILVILILKMNIFIYLSIINAVKSFSNIAPKLKPSLLNIVCRADLRIRRRLNGLPGEDPGPQLTSQPDPQLYLEATTRSAVPQIVF